MKTNEYNRESISYNLKATKYPVEVLRSCDINESCLWGCTPFTTVFI